MESTKTPITTEVPNFKILLTGATGQVGWELQHSLSKLGQVIACDRNSLDLTDSQVIRETVRSLRPNLIVNAAAYTAVDRAESEPELAIAINQIAPKILAESAAEVGSAMIHYSTDYVFDGKLDRPYREDDLTNPLSIYGKTKLAGEQEIAATGIPHLIFRTSWVYGSRGKNFMLTMLRLAREKTELRIVADQIGAPTWSRLIAETTTKVIEKIQILSELDTRQLNELEIDIQSQSFSQSDSCSFFHKMSEYNGIYHLTNSGFTSWHGFAQAIFKANPKSSDQILERVIAIATSDYPTPAHRPANSRLDLQKLSQTFKLKLPNWESSLTDAIAD
jgi:dTDP-4-dehydrorhamnose reductase